jgi:hypothetical protein
VREVALHEHDKTRYNGSRFQPRNRNGNGPRQSYAYRTNDPRVKRRRQIFAPDSDYDDNQPDLSYSFDDIRRAFSETRHMMLWLRRIAIGAVVFGAFFFISACL